MSYIYRNNRLVPAIVILICLILFYCFIDPSIQPGETLQVVSVEKSSEQAAAIVPQKPVTEATTSHKANPPSQTTKSSSSAPKASSSPSSIQHNGLSADDVLLIVKTGGTTIWKRLLIHLTTSLDENRIKPENIAIYSDQTQTVGRFQIIDALANMTSEMKAKEDFAVYRQLPEYDSHNYYVEAAGVAGDEWGPVGGWIIDKYKFVPLVEHAGAHWPKAKWYIYMEDDAYLFLPNVISYLSSFDASKPHYLGSYAAKSDVIFAHGGAGFALSRGAWEQSFGSTKESLTSKYYQYTKDHCCGDQVLALALRDHDVKFGENGGDGKFTWGFNPLVHWNFAFEQSNWCKPVLSWHKVHSRDVARYYDLEKSWDFSTKGPLMHGDFFKHMILPDVKKRAEWWDNQSGVYSVASGNNEWSPKPPKEAKYDAALWKKAWQSVDDCEAACMSWDKCMQWAYVEDLCKMDDKMMMGQGYAEGMSQRKTALMHTSGWLYERLENWKCS